jgi:hypothetical protein
MGPAVGAVGTQIPGREPSLWSSGRHAGRSSAGSASPAVCLPAPAPGRPSRARRGGCRSGGEPAVRDPRLLSASLRSPDRLAASRCAPMSSTRSSAAHHAVRRLLALGLSLTFGSITGVALTPVCLLVVRALTQVEEESLVREYRLLITRAAPQEVRACGPHRGRPGPGSGSPGLSALLRRELGPCHAAGGLREPAL